MEIRILLESDPKCILHEGLWTHVPGKGDRIYIDKNFYVVNQIVHFAGKDKCFVVVLHVKLI